MIFVALAALLWGLGGALAGRFMREIGPVPDPHPRAVGGILYLVTLGTVVPFGLFLQGVRTVPARTATLVAMLEPLSGALFA